MSLIAPRVLFKNSYSKSINTCHLLFIGVFLPVVLKSQPLTNYLSDDKTVQAISPGNVSAFIENKGQITDTEGNLRNDILYYTETGRSKIYLRNAGLSYVMWDKPAETDIDQPIAGNTITRGHRVDLDFKGANRDMVIYSENPSPDYFNYYLSHCKQGITNVHSYSKIVYQNLYNNIDVVFYSGNPEKLKYDIIVRPGGNPADIKLKYTGADNLTLENEELIIGTSLGDIREYIPKVYQQINGQVVSVETKYILSESTIGFELAHFDSKQPLIIDPAVWVTYVGTNQPDFGYGLDVDPNGNVFCTGQTWGSFAIAVTAGAFQAAHGGGFYDAYLFKFNSSGVRQWATYYGGTENDYGYAVAADAAGNIICTGGTFSNNLPGTAAGYQAVFAGSVDAFVIKLDASGALVWATYYGGSSSERGYGAATNTAGDVIITGMTYSGNLPGTAGSFQPAFGGNTDVFLIKFSPAGALSWSTYYGGWGADKAYDVETDNAGNIVLTGGTGGGFSLLSAAQAAYGGGSSDAFVVKFNTAGVRQWATYLGGSDWDEGVGVDADMLGNVIVTGSTYSSNFPVSAGALQAAYGGGPLPANRGDVFIVKYSFAGVRLWATYFGGSNVEEGVGVVTDPNNDIYIVGDTYSADFPVTSCASQTTFGGDEDNFIAKISASGNLICSGFFGGPGHDEHRGGGEGGGGVVAVHNGMVSFSASSMGGLPTTPGAFQTNFRGGIIDGCVARLCGQTCGKKIPIVDFTANQTSICVGSSVNFIDISSTCDTSGNRWQWYFTGGTPSTSTVNNPSNIVYNSSGVFPVKLVLTTLCGNDSLTKNGYITVNGPTASITSVSNVNCSAAANGSIIAQVVGGTGVYTYSWIPASANGPSATGLVPGSYSLIVSDASGCTSLVSATITEPPALNVYIPVQTNIACYGNTTGGAMATAIGGSPAYNYSWSGSASTTQTISGMAAGSYTVTVTDVNGCTAMAAVNLTQPALLTANINSQNNVLCAGNANGSASVLAAGGTGQYTYSWTTIPAQNGASISGLNIGSYSVTITDANGCTSATNITITEPPVIVLNTASTPAHCSQADGTANVNAAGGIPGYSYSWSNGQTNASITNVVSGNYTVTVSDINGCSTSATILIPNNSGVTAQLTNSTSPGCFGSCDGSATIAGNGGDAPYSYTWNTAPLQNTSLATGLCAGIYNVTVTDVNGCSDTLNITITQPLQVIVNTSQAATICIGENATLTAGASGGTPNYTFIWQPGNTNGTPININPSSTTVYTLTVSDANGCSAIATSTVIVNPPLQVIAVVPAAICAGNIAQLSAMGNGGNGIYNFTWLPQGVPGNQLLVSPGTTTSYSVVLTDNCGTPTDTAEVMVTVNQPPVITCIANDSVGCEPLCVQFTNTTNNSIACVWNFGDGSSSTLPAPIHCYNSHGVYSVSLSVTDINGCSTTLSKPAWMVVHPNPVAVFSATPPVTTILNPGIYFKDESQLANLWLWSFGDVANSASTQQNPVFVYEDTGTYVTQLIVINEFGCRDTAQQEIRIDPDYAVYIPNSFTPNGDGHNDHFLPSGMGIDENNFEMWIYNRWGENIFYTNDISRGWDGRAGGESLAQIDTYVWKIRTTDLYKKKRNYVGHVNLIR